MRIYIYTYIFVTLTNIIYWEEDDISFLYFQKDRTSKLYLSIA